MATYAELTSEEKSVLDSWLNNVRALAGEMARVGNHAGAAKTAYWAQISAILAKLDTGAVIPNAGGLAGAQALTKEQLTTLESHVEAQDETNDADHRTVWVLACGMANLIG